MEGEEGCGKKQIFTHAFVKWNLYCARDLIGERERERKEYDY